ncbi:hypothetical protein AX16_002179 [Volvariella volvacea WC 439]|nr:hypothetical protein AX16_002179 [Volvariella volvacea WC 439]
MAPPPPTKVTIPDTKKVTVDEDLDDLDDVLDEFDNNSRPSAPPPTASKTTFSNRPRTNTRVDQAPFSIPSSSRAAALDPTSEIDEDALSAEFAKELAKGMEELMKELATDGGKLSGDASGSGDAEADVDKALKAAWEAMLVEGMNGAVDPSKLGGQELGADGVAGSSSKPAGGESDFQQKIRQAREKMRKNEEDLKNKSSGETPSQQSLEALLSSLNDLGLGSGGDEEEELAGFIQNMMGELMSKEILYDPLNELAKSFPPYLASPPKPLSPEDRKRYESQLVIIKKIIATFDEPTYDDNNPVTSKKVMDLMTELQSHGQPPEEIMGPLPQGLTPEGLPDGCTIA